MRHPQLPDDQTIVAQDPQVPHYQRSGWEVVDDDPPAGDAPPTEQGDPPPTTEKTTPEAPAAAGASALPGTDKAPRGQRASKEMTRNGCYADRAGNALLQPGNDQDLLGREHRQQGRAHASANSTRASTSPSRSPTSTAGWSARR